MKISYGITVYNEYKELDNLLYHLSKHIREEDEVVVTRDISKVGDKSIMQDDFYALEKVLEKYEYNTFFEPRQLKVTTFEFRKDFSKLKNYTKEHCSGDYIFHIDADEIPNEILLKQLPEILEINDTDLVWVPRINIVNGITEFHMNLWKWRQTEQGWINFPDYQARIFRNTEDIKWVKPVHEVIDGAKTYSHLPPHEELTLKHEKDIVRQEVQNKLYDQII
jgi:glycosyltransferase involved in cell wall biosynthesis